MECYTQHNKSIMDLFNQPSQAVEKEECPKKVAAVKQIQYDPSQDDKIDELSEQVMAKVRAKMEALKNKTQEEEEEIKR